MGAPAHRLIEGQRFTGSRIHSDSGASLSQAALISSNRRSLLSIAGPVEAWPTNALAVDFVVEPDRAQLNELVQRVRGGRLRPNIGTVASLDQAVTALNPTERTKGKTIIRIRP